MTDRSDEIRERAIDTLRAMRDWRLPPDDWAHVSAVLDTMQGRLDLAEPDQAAALEQATFALEVLGPERLGPISTNHNEARSATEGVNDRAGRIIHVLTTPPEEGTDEDARVAG